MRAYACVYRKVQPTDAELRATQESAKGHPLLQQFLDAYPDSFLDWGDDPSFFSAERLLGNIHQASWGVCRPDVRDSIREGGVGSFVVFFVGVAADGRWHYYWTGVGTVARFVHDRQELFASPHLKPYGGFLNVLVRPGRAGLEHHEVFRPHHDDWARRIEAPYVVFDPSLSRFNVRDPLHVSTYVVAKGVPDRWRTEDKTVREVEQLIYGNRDDRRLRTAPTMNAHVKFRLKGTGRQLVELRTRLLGLFDARR